MGAVGEEIATRWLAQRGLRVERRNIVVDRGEIDIIARDGDRRVLVEVRTITGPGDPADAIDREKRRHIAALGRRVGAARVDLLGVGLRSWGLEIHWVPGGSW